MTENTKSINWDWLRWTLIFVVIIGFIWLMGGVVTPYLVGMALAYFLDPLADRLEDRGLSRRMSVIIISIVAAIVIIFLFLVIVPSFTQQLIAFAVALPDYADWIINFIKEKVPSLPVGEGQILEWMQTHMQTIGTKAAEIVVNSTSTLFAFIAAFVIIPVVTFFMLLDWDKLVARVNSWLPHDHASSLRQLFGDINKTLASFVRGQGTVCLIMAIYYAIALVLLGVNYGIVLGVIAGILTFIPFVGAFIAGILVVGVSAVQAYTGVQLAASGEEVSWIGHSWSWFGAVMVLYFGGQTFEGNFLTPKLVGNAVGLHPVWIMFALSAGGAIMGLTGMLIAVPVAATIGVVGRHLLERYQSSRLFWGQDYKRYLASENEKSQNS